MSATPTPTESPVHVQPLHNPSQAAHVVVPQAPLGNATNGTASQAPGLGAKALLAKKMAKNMYVVPVGCAPHSADDSLQQSQVRLPDGQHDDALHEED